MGSISTEPQETIATIFIAHAAHQPPRLVAWNGCRSSSLPARPWRDARANDQGKPGDVDGNQCLPQHSGCKSGEAAERCLGGAVFFSYVSTINRQLMVMASHFLA